MNTTKAEQDIIEWFVSNGSLINPIIQDYKRAKEKLMELEPIVFHEDIEKEFEELVIQKISDLVTFQLALPIEMVYNTIEDKKLLIKTLDRNLNQ